MDAFLELLRESTIVQGLIALAIVIGVVYLYATGQAVPPELAQLLTLVLGFYFGTKTQAAITRVNGAAKTLNAQVESLKGK